MKLDKEDIKLNKEDIKKEVRKYYGNIAETGSSCCCSGSKSSCCGSTGSISSLNSAESIAGKIGYGKDDIEKVPEGSNLGLGCGNPTAFADIKKGETILDLGSGAGFDCFLASEKVGENGKVIGIDMTQEMLDKATKNAVKYGYKNVEFIKGEIENLPVKDNSIDLIISNCVINLSTDKYKVFREMYRVLRPGGRFTISDIVLLSELPDFLKSSAEAYSSCISGAILKEDYIGKINQAGFKDIRILNESTFSLDYFLNPEEFIKDSKRADSADMENLISSISVSGKK